MSLSNKEIKNYVKPAIEDIRNVEKIFLEARESYDLAPDRIDRSATSVREEGIQGVYKGVCALHLLHREGSCK